MERNVSFLSQPQVSKFKLCTEWPKSAVSFFRSYVISRQGDYNIVLENYCSFYDHSMTFDIFFFTC